MTENQPLVYSTKDKAFGYMTKMDYKARTVTFETMEGDAVIEIAVENAVIMHSFGEAPDGTPLYDGDIFESHVSSNLYEAELVDCGFLQFHLLNNKLERQHSVDKYSVPKFLQMLKEANTYEVIGSKYEVEIEEDVDFDFNIKVVKKELEFENAYYYACNDKDKKQVDFIKVVFVGSILLKEEDYNRVTVSYEDFELYMNNSAFEEVSPYELQSYAMGKRKPEAVSPCDDCDCESEEDCEMIVEAPQDFSESDSEDDKCDCVECNDRVEPATEELEEELVCNECDKAPSKCECELWKRSSK